MSRIFNGVKFKETSNQDVSRYMNLQHINIIFFIGYLVVFNDSTDNKTIQSYESI